MFISTGNFENSTGIHIVTVKKVRKYFSSFQVFVTRHNLSLIQNCNIYLRIFRIYSCSVRVFLCIRAHQGRLYIDQTKKYMYLGQWIFHSLVERIYIKGIDKYTCTYIFKKESVFKSLLIKRVCVYRYNHCEKGKKHDLCERLHVYFRYCVTSLIFQ